MATRRKHSPGVCTGRITETNLRYSQMAPLTMYDEVNTGNNLPVQFDIMAAPGEHHADEFHLMFVAKGGGSANKSFLFQETRAILSPERLLKFLETKMKTLRDDIRPVRRTSPWRS